ncbi:SAM-dependent methyltransferase [Bacillus sp. DNRA2]|uniref:class I SAM-dependent methyltransferase n=1 Tax=Bacillus sp. DNRA2 TaxID=2723053 RepID=UPI001B7D2058|nr:SAM-dependent methyltransferase [Bacillus sp. DNRA2]
MKELLKQKLLALPNRMISYAEFMELVLYHPEHGYYMKEGQKIGRDGDFYTTSNVSDLYGSMVAKWYREIALQFGIKPEICEIGAGTGRFAQSFINEWQRDCSVPLKYTIVETSPYHRKIQRDKIQFNEQIKQISSLDELEPFEGLLFSNELVDALPVHVIEKQAGALFEVMVSIDGDKLVEVNVPLNNEYILAFMKEQELDLTEGQRIEIPVAMCELISSLSGVLTKGIALMVDYGYTKEEWLEPTHKNGSLRGYYQHQMIANVLQNPGLMDITSHVHFDAFIDYGEKAGFTFIEKLRQDEFFLAIGILKELQDHFDPNPFSEQSKRNRAIRSLIMPTGPSPSFRVVLQHKGLLAFENAWVEAKQK